MNASQFKFVLFLLVTTIGFSGCSSLSTRHQKNEEAAKAAEPATPTPTETKAEVAPPASATPVAQAETTATPPASEKISLNTPPKTVDDGGPQIVLKPKKGRGPILVEKPASKTKQTEEKVVSEPIAETSPTSLPMVTEPPAAAESLAKVESHPKIEGVEPAQSLHWLQNGNKRFVKGYFRTDGASKKDILRLSKGQKPHAIILACSESGAPPELVFDQKLGEVIVIRTAGESLDANVIASIEYAVDHLGPRLLVVMGHNSCGAISAAVESLGGKDAGSPALNHLVADIQPRIKDITNHTSHGLTEESLANAAGVAGDLMRRSALIKQAVDEGRLVIKSALYEMDSGEVKFQ